MKSKFTIERIEEKNGMHSLKMTDEDGKFVIRGPVNGGSYPIVISVYRPVTELHLNTDGKITLVVGRIQSNIVSQ